MERRDRVVTIGGHRIHIEARRRLSRETWPGFTVRANFVDGRELMRTKTDFVLAKEAIEGAEITLRRKNRRDGI